MSQGKGVIRPFDFKRNIARGRSLRMAADDASGSVKPDESRFIDEISGSKA